MKKRLILLVLILLLAISMTNVTAFGASANLAVSGGGTYTKGNTVNITYTYSGTNFGVANTNITYDSSVLKYKSCSGGTASAASGVLNVIAGDGNKRSSLSVTVSFEAIKAGSSTVTVSTGSGGVVDYDGNDLSVSSRSATVTVKDPAPQVSGNANLSSLKVSAGSLSPAFSPSRTSYTVNVGKDVSVCTISATPEHSKASVSVSGSKNLSEGKNVRTVTVTAENGATKTYTITINRSSSVTGGDNPASDDPDTPEPDAPQAIEVTVGEVQYTVVESIEEGSLPEGFDLTLAQYGEYEIPVIKDKNLKYTFALLKNGNTGDEEWFFYDEETDTFSSSSQLSVDEALEYGKLLARTGGEEEEDALGIGETEKILMMALGGTLAAMLVAIIVLQTKIIRRNKTKTNNNSKEEVIIEDEES